MSFRSSSIRHKKKLEDGAVMLVRHIVDDVRMIREQLRIGEEHDGALKRRAREIGVSEADLVRRLLDGLVVEEGAGALAGSGATVALDDFFTEADRVSEEHRFPEAYRFERDELYENRGVSSGG